MGKEVGGGGGGETQESPRLKMESTRQTRKRMTKQKIYESRRGKQSNLRTWILMLISPVSLEAIKREYEPPPWPPRCFAFCKHLPVSAPDSQEVN